MQNTISTQAQENIIENEPIVFDLQLNEFGYPVKAKTIYPLPIALRGVHWITFIAEIFFILLNPPSLDYEWFDWLNLIILTLTNLAFFTNLSYFKSLIECIIFILTKKKLSTE